MLDSGFDNPSISFTLTLQTGNRKAGPLLNLLSGSMPEQKSQAQSGAQEDKYILLQLGNQENIRKKKGIFWHVFDVARKQFKINCKRFRQYQVSYRVKKLFLEASI